MSVVVAIGCMVQVVSPRDLLAIRIAGLLLCLAGVASLVVQFVHDRQLCEICAGMTPVDGKQQAKRHRLALRTVHGGKVLTAVTVLLAIVYVGLWVSPVPDWVTQAYLSALLLGSGFYGRAQFLHRYLQPWCPYCNWGDGGKHERSPKPDPSIQKVL